MSRSVPDDNLSLVPIPGMDFLRMLSRVGRSAEVGPVASQYAERLRADDEMVGAFALVTCESRPAAISYGIHKSPRGGMSARLDTVLVDPKIRRGGVGALVMALLFERLLTDLGEDLINISTMAVHPAVAHVVEAAGFERAPGRTPLYSMRLGSDEAHDSFAARNRTVLTRRQGYLKTQCLNCEHKPWGKPWCEGAA